MVSMIRPHSLPPPETVAFGMRSARGGVVEASGIETATGRVVDARGMSVPSIGGVSD